MIFNDQQYENAGLGPRFYFEKEKTFALRFNLSRFTTS
jgi:hypothetical protein